MRRDAEKIPVNYRLRPEIANMIEELIGNPEMRTCKAGYNRTDIVELAIMGLYWKEREVIKK